MDPVPVIAIDSSQGKPCSEDLNRVVYCEVNKTCLLHSRILRLHPVGMNHSQSLLNILISHCTFIVKFIINQPNDCHLMHQLSASLLPITSPYRSHKHRDVQWFHVASHGFAVGSLWVRPGFPVGSCWVPRMATTLPEGRGHKGPADGERSSAQEDSQRQ